ncbi:MAG: hypothetical protein AB1938_14585 [Myxococcota bacterium]
MKTPGLTVGFVLVLWAFSAAAECSVSTKDFKPQFAAKLPKGFKLLSTKSDTKAKLYRQELKLPTGETVTLEMGGCERFKYSFFIKGPTVTTKTVGAEVLAVSRRVLPALPMKEDAIADPKRLAKALDEAEIVSLPSPLPCASGTCQVAVEPDPKAKKDKPKPRPKPKGKGKDDQAEEKKDEPAADAPGLIRLSWEAPEP